MLLVGRQFSHVLQRRDSLWLVVEIKSGGLWLAFFRATQKCYDGFWIMLRNSSRLLYFSFQELGKDERKESFRVCSLACGSNPFIVIVW